MKYELSGIKKVRRNKLEDFRRQVASVSAIDDKKFRLCGRLPLTVHSQRHATCREGFYAKGGEFICCRDIPAANRLMELVVFDVVPEYAWPGRGKANEQRQDLWRYRKTVG